MPERLLLLTYAFPPLSVPEAALAAKKVGNLPCESHVICIEPFKQWMGYDRSLDRYVATRFASIERIRAPFIRRHIPLGRLGALTKVPDQFRFFNGLIERKARLRLHEFDYLLTWSQWHSIHLVGAALRRTNADIIWAAHLSDPWSNNPYLRHGPVVTRLNRRLEARTLRDADILMFPSNETAQHVLGNLPTDIGGNHAIVPHSFDAALYPPRTPDHNEQISVVYVGSFYGPRTPDPLIRAIRCLLETEPDLLRGVSFRIVGSMQRDLHPSALDLPEGLLRIDRPVEYVKSLSIMSSADVLLLVDAPAEKSVFLPSKLIDYLGAKKPIVGFTPPGPANDLIARYGGWRADPTDTEGCASAIRGSLEWVRGSGAQEFGDPLIRTRYAAETVSAELDVVLRRRKEKIGT